MRTLDTPVKQIRRKIFTEVAKLGFESTDDTLIHDIEVPETSSIRELAEQARTLNETLSKLLEPEKDEAD